MSMSWLLYSHLMLQLSMLFFYFYPVLFLSIPLLMTTYLGTASGRLKTERKDFFNIFEWRLPLIQYRFDYNLYVFICAFLAFTLVLGRHVGNYMNYAYQLLVPSFFCWFFQKFNFKDNPRKVAILVILFNLFMWQGNLLSPSMLEQKNSKEWARLFSYIQSSSNILNSQLDTSEIVRLGLSPIDTGQSIVFYLVKPFPKNQLTDVSYEAVVADGVKYTRFIDQSIEKQKFDLVIVVNEKAVFYHIKRLGSYYYLVDTINLDMPQAGQHWTVSIWKPALK